jgi:succinate-acetate transporter protein
LEERRMSDAPIDGKLRMTEPIKIVDCTAAPESMGMFLLGWIVLLFALMNLKMFAMGTMLIMTVFFTGFGFLLVAWMGWKKGEIFFLWAFMPVAVFTWTFSIFMLLAQLGLKGITGSEMGWFFVIFALFVVLYGIITLHAPSRLFPLLMFTAALLFFVGGLHSFMPTQTILQDFFGVFGLFVGSLAVYIGFAITINTVHGKMTMPMFLKKAAKPTIATEKKGPANSG